MRQFLVWTDFGSSALWVRLPLGAWAAADYPADLPCELRDRLSFMAAWFDKARPDGGKPEPDWPAYESYALGLAIDLKRHFGDAAAIFVEVAEKVVEVTGDLCRMTRPAPPELGWAKLT